MKKLLQRISDGLYYQAPGTWTAEPDLALAFDKGSRAIECCVHENLSPMQLVLKFDGDGFDVRLPCRTGHGLLLRPPDQDASA